MAPVPFDLSALGFSSSNIKMIHAQMQRYPGDVKNLMIKRSAVNQGMHHIDIAFVMYVGNLKFVASAKVSDMFDEVIETIQSLTHIDDVKCACVNIFQWLLFEFPRK
jgi:hypothetical protein